MPRVMHVVRLCVIGASRDADQWTAATSLAEKLCGFALFVDHFHASR